MASGLVEMNARMVQTGDARALICAGVIVAWAGLLLALCVVISKKKEHKRLYAALFMAVAVAGGVMVIHGTRLPRVKEIRACAVGPLSLEQVAGVYDIVNVDGKELVLRER